MPHLAIPNLGNYTIALASFVDALGVEAWATTATTPTAMRYGLQAAPESICLPFKAHLGHYIEAARAGVEYAMMVNSIGTCRLRYYRHLADRILKEQGYTSAMFGKWDLAGHSQGNYIKDLLPRGQGFDYYFGTPGSNDAVVNIIRMKR